MTEADGFPIENAGHDGDGGRCPINNFGNERKYWIQWIENSHHCSSEITHDRFAGYGRDGYKATKSQVSLLYCADGTCPVPNPFL